MDRPWPPSTPLSLSKRARGFIWNTPNPDPRHLHPHLHRDPSLPSLCSPNEREGIADPPPPANADTYRHVPNIRWGRAEGIFFKKISIFILIFIGKDNG